MKSVLQTPEIVNFYKNVCRVNLVIHQSRIVAIMKALSCMLMSSSAYLWLQVCLCLKNIYGNRSIDIARIAV